MARRAITINPDNIDPIDGAVQDDRMSIADQLGEVLEGLSGIDQGSIQGILYRIPVPNGKFEWIRDVYPPFDLSDIMRSLKEEIGGGDYALRIRAEGKIRKTINFSIMKERNHQSLMTKDTNNDGMMTMFQMMMAMQNENARASQAAADRQMQMMMQSNQQSTQMMLGMVTAMQGNREKMSDVIPLFAAMRPEPVQSGGMKEAIETLVSAKALFSDSSGSGGAGFDPEGSMIENGVKMIGPLIGGVQRMLENRRADPQQQIQQVQTVTPVPEQVFSLPANPSPPVPSASPYPVLDLIGPEVLFLFQRGRSFELAAETAMALIDEAQVPEEQINELVAAFTVSSDWIADFAKYGVDLSSNRGWADGFLNTLLQLYTDTDGELPDSGRGRGRETDPQYHGASSETGLAVDVGTQPVNEPLPGTGAKGLSGGSE